MRRRFSKEKGNTLHLSRPSPLHSHLESVGMSTQHPQCCNNNIQDTRGGCIPPSLVRAPRPEFLPNFTPCRVKRTWGWRGRGWASERLRGQSSHAALWHKGLCWENNAPLMPQPATTPEPARCCLNLQRLLAKIKYPRPALATLSQSGFSAT